MSSTSSTADASLLNSADRLKDFNL